MYLILINSLVLLGFYVTRAALNKDNIVYILFGAQYGPLVARGEWFRLATAMFMHGGFLHLAFNMYALYILGSYVESIYGTDRFLSYYFLTGLAGNLATHVFYYNSLSVGASGAIFGLVGALFGAGFRRDTPFYLRPITGTALLPMIVLNIILGFIPGTNINNAAHIGGLLAGVILGFFLPVHDNYRTRLLWRFIARVLVVFFGLSYVLLISSLFNA